MKKGIRIIQIIMLAGFCIFFIIYNRAAENSGRRGVDRLRY